MIRAYFALYGVAGVFVTSGMIVAALFPRLQMRVPPAGHPFLAIIGGVLFTYSAFRTSSLLRARKRLGGWAAGVTFVSALAAAGGNIAASAVGLVVNGIGLLLLASTWRQLE